MKLHRLQTCLFCHKARFCQYALCWSCYQQLPWLSHACQHCAVPIDRLHQYCGRCLSHSSPIKTTSAIFMYEPPIKRLITNFKFHHQLKHTRLFSALLAQKIQAYYYNKPQPQALIPMPLHNKRLKERGFNQSDILCKPLSKQCGIIMDTTLCKRIKNTHAQSLLDAKARKQNIRGAFSIQKKSTYTHVAIIDDVITTGLTTRELAETLKKSGINTIDCFALARARNS
jgi:ComF family protein